MVVLRNQIGHKQLFQFFLDRKDFRIILWLVPRELGMPLRELRQEFFHLVKTQHMVPLQDCTFFFNVMIQMILVLCQVNQILWFLARYIFYNVWGCTFFAARAPHVMSILIGFINAKMSSLNQCHKRGIAFNL